MRKGILKDKIIFGLSSIETYVSHLNEKGRTDENLDLEDFFCDYLNICDSSASFSNLNKDKNNYPGIDLGDKKKKVSYQISSDGSRGKVVKTISKFESNELFEDFDELNILIIGKKPKYQKAFETNGKYSFNKNDNVLGIKELISQLNDLENDQLVNLVELIESEYDGIYATYDSGKTTRIKVNEEENYPELQASIKLRNNGYPKQALDLLDEIEKTKFDESDDEFKYKLLANKGLCYLDLIKNQEAAELFIKALKYKPDNDKSLGFAAMGQFLLGIEEKAEKLAMQAVKINPKSELAYTTLINIWSKNDDFETKVKSLPKELVEQSSIAYQLGKKFQEIGNYRNAKKHFEKAVENNTERDPDLKGALGTLILENALNPFLYVTGQLDEEAKSEIKYAISLLQEAWKEVERNDLRDSRTFWLVNIATGKKVLNDPDGAYFDLKLAASIAPHELFTQRQYAISLFEAGDTKEALIQIEKCKQLDQTNDPIYDLFEAEIHYKDGNYNECLNILKKELKRVKFDGTQEAIFLEIACLEGLGKDESAIAKCDDLIKNDRFKVRALIAKSKLLRKGGDYDGFKENLDKAINLIDDRTTHENIHDVVKLLDSEKRFTEQISLLNRITNKNAYSELTKLLITAYFKTGNYKDALDLISKLKVKVGLRDYLIDIESMILFQIHDYEGAKTVCEIYLKNDPEHPFILMRLAFVLSKMQNNGELTAILARIENVNDKPFDFRIQYSLLLAQCGQLDDALENAYEARRDNYKNGHVHLGYFQLFNQIEQKDEKDLVSLNKVYFDSTVYLYDKKSNQTLVKTLLNTSSPKYDRGELGFDDHLTKELMSKTKGDLVNSEEGVSYEIQEITTKYVGAYRESIGLLGAEYKNISGFESFKVKDKEEGAERDFKEDFAPIYEKMSEDESFHRLMEGQYQAGSLPIGSFASFSKKNFIKVWIHLAQSNHLGIVHYGNDLENNTGVSLIQAGRKMVFTLSSLLSLYHVAKDEVKLLSNKRFVARSSIDTIDDLLHEWKYGKGRGGHLVLAKSGDQLIREEVTVEDLEKSIDHYAEFKKWCEDNFEIIPNVKETELDQKEKEKQDQIFGESFIDSIHIAETNEALLVDDDSRFRQLAKQKFEIDSIGVYTIAQFCLKSDFIDVTRFHDILYDLASINYKQIPCSRDFLLHVTEKLKFQLTNPLTDLLAEFGSEFFEMGTSINILVLYLKEIYLRTNQVTLEKFADFVIQIIMRRRNFVQAKAHFFNSLIVHFKYLDLQRLRILEIWNQYETV